MKNLTIIYCGEDGDAGKALANSMRENDSDNKVVLSSVEQFSPVDEVDHVIIMPDVPGFCADKIREAYPGKVANKPKPYADFDVYVELVSIDPATTITFTDTPKKRGRPRKAA